MEHSILWNLNWKFTDHFEPGFLQKDGDDAVLVCLPHTVRELPLNCFSHHAAEMISTYSKVLNVKEEYAGKRLLLVFDGVMTYFELYINGAAAGEHKGGYSRSRFDITDFVHQGENRVVVKVDSHEREDIPPFGYAVDYMTYGGIYRDVHLCICEQSFIEQALVKYDIEENAVMLKPEILLSSSQESYEGMVQINVGDGNGCIVHSYKRRVMIEPGIRKYGLGEELLPDVRLWNPDEPVLYKVVFLLLDSKGRKLDSHSVRTGFRTIRCTPDGVYVNGKHIKIMGLNRHQAYPYTGYAMGKRAQAKDADILKEFGANAVRTSHYMQSEYFLDRCDEIGLLVFSEIPGWGHIGGDEFKRVMMNDVEAMITTQYNHPGIFIWSIHINESLDDDELYEKANALARQLDPSRPTTGVRYIVGSHLLEDVYSMNDFTYSDCDPDRKSVV